MQAAARIAVAMIVARGMPQAGATAIVVLCPDAPAKKLARRQLRAAREGRGRAGCAVRGVGTPNGQSHAGRHVPAAVGSPQPMQYAPGHKAHGAVACWQHVLAASGDEGGEGSGEDGVDSLSSATVSCSAS